MPGPLNPQNFLYVNQKIKPYFYLPVLVTVPLLRRDIMTKERYKISYLIKGFFKVPE